MSSTTVHYYDSTGMRIVRTREYASYSLALRAMRRAQSKGQIAVLAGDRQAKDQPTCHH